MFLFKHKSDILPISIILLSFILDIYLYAIGITGIWLGLYCIFSIRVKGYVAAWNHHHQHHKTFSLPIMNRLLEIMYGIQTGAVGYGWVLHHNLGHHVHFQDQEKDESAWKSPEGKTYNAFQYTWIVGITAYKRMWIVGNKHKKIQKYFLNMCFIQVFILAILLILQPLQAVFIFIIPMVFIFFGTAYATHGHHSGLESDDPYHSSYNIIDPWYNIMTGNLGYHTAHHLKGGMHWSKLPDFHKSIEHKIDKKYYKKGHMIR